MMRTVINGRTFLLILISIRSKRVGTGHLEIFGCVNGTCTKFGKGINNATKV